MLRFLLAVVRADFYNPVSQFLVKVTNPALLPLRRIFPSVGKLDTSALVLMLALQILSFTLIALLRGGAFSIAALLMLSVTELFSLFLNVLLFSEPRKSEGSGRARRRSFSRPRESPKGFYFWRVMWHRSSAMTFRRTCIPARPRCSRSAAGGWEPWASCIRK